MADVFVSYKAEDRRRVKPLVDARQAEGFSVWWTSRSAAGPLGGKRSRASSAPPPVLIAQNNFEEAQPYLQKVSPDNYNRMVGEAVILARTGRRAEVAPIIANMFKVYGETTSFQLGQIYAETGDKDRAFAALDRAWAIRDAGLLRLRRDPFIDPLRSDPRYAALLRKMNFPA